VPQFGNKEISNNNFLYYSTSCSYIINNNLPNNNEFLNKVSALDISLVGTNCKLSFNKGRHSTYVNNNPSTIYDLSFGLGKGSYIIIDISSAFPIRLSKDISNLIAIDRGYQPSRIKDVIYDKTTGIIKEVPALHYVKASKHFTLKNLEKRVSTLKSLTPKKIANSTIKNKNATQPNDSESDNEN
jgi:hypothetical protein